MASTFCLKPLITVKMHAQIQTRVRILQRDKRAKIRSLPGAGLALDATDVHLRQGEGRRGYRRCPLAIPELDELRGEGEGHRREGREYCLSCGYSTGPACQLVSKDESAAREQSEEWAPYIQGREAEARDPEEVED